MDEISILKESEKEKANEIKSNVIDDSKIQTAVHADPMKRMEENDLILRAPQKKSGKKAGGGKEKKAPLFSANLSRIAGDLQSDREHAKDLLVDSFKEQNEAYAKSEAFAADEKAVEDYRKKISNGVKLSYRKRITKENKLMNVQISVLAADKKFGFRGDDDDMKDIKRSINLLQRMLRGDMRPYMVNGKLDAVKFTNNMEEAFNTAIGACNAYLELHPSPISWWGRRRKARTAEMLSKLNIEKLQYTNVLSAIEAGTFEKGLDEISSPQDLIESLRMVKITKRVFQREGNSQDVYFATVVEDEEGREYYIKENLPLLHRDMSGFLERRQRQLSKSWENKQSYAEDKIADKDHEDELKEELRMEKAHADQTDYQNGLDLIRLLKARIDNASAADREAVRAKCAEVFRYDFDSMFKKLLEHNAAVKLYNETIKKQPKIALEDWKEKAKKDDSAKLIYEILKEIKENAGKPDAKNQDGPQMMSASAWMIKKMGLSSSKDSDLIKLFKKIDEKQAVNPEMKQGADGYQVGRLEALFRITMGKEVELYGQMMEGGKLKESEMSQYNTMVTSYLSDHYGFMDEVVSTKLRFSEFTRWDGQQTSGAITMQDVARGGEWIDVLKTAKEKNEKVRLTHNSVRQLLRLQMFDTVSQQKDRHGRNFKCVMSKKSGSHRNVKSIKAYDHDQSFAPNSIADSFKEKKGKDGKLIEESKNRFLPSTLKVVKKDSAMYRYIAERYFNYEPAMPQWMQDMKEEPKILNGKKGDTKAVPMTPLVKSMILTMMYGHKTFEVKEDDGPYKKGVKHKTCVGAFDVKKDFKFVEYDRFDGRTDNSLLIARDGSVRYVSDDEKFQDVVDELKDIITVLGDFYVVDEPDWKKWKEMYELSGKRHDGLPVADVCFRRPKNVDRTKLREVSLKIKRLKELNDRWDFSQFTIQSPFIKNNFQEAGDRKGEFIPQYANYGNGEICNIFQAWVDMTLYVFAQSYGQDPQVAEYMSNGNGPDEFDELRNENGDLEVPSLLHADKEAYDDIVRMIHDFEDPKDLLRSGLRHEHMTEEAIEATYQRAKEMKERLEYMAEKARPFLKAMYPRESDVRRKFFLEKEDYKKFRKLDEFAIDPGDSYLVQDNEQFLKCQRMYQKHMTKQEIANEVEARNKVLTDSKRWNAEAEKSLKTVVDMDIAYDNDAEEDPELFLTKGELVRKKDEDARKKREEEERKKEEARKKGEEQRTGEEEKEKAGDAKEEKEQKPVLPTYKEWQKKEIKLKSENKDFAEEAEKVDEKIKEAKVYFQKLRGVHRSLSNLDKPEFSRADLNEEYKKLGFPPLDENYNLETAARVNAGDLVNPKEVNMAKLALADKLNTAAAVDLGNYNSALREIYNFKPQKCREEIAEKIAIYKNQQGRILHKLAEDKAKEIREKTDEYRKKWVVYKK